MLVYHTYIGSIPQYSLESLCLLGITWCVITWIAIASTVSVLDSAPSRAPSATSSYWSHYVTTWYVATLTLVVYHLILSIGSVTMALYGVTGWSLLGAMLLSIPCILSSIGASYTYTMRASIYLDVIGSTGVLSAISTVGSWLYSVLYLTLRMWLVFALHGFCTGCVSELLTCTLVLPILGVSTLLTVGAGTLAYVCIQTYVYTTFTVMYLCSDVLTYYSLISVTICLALPWSLSLVSVTVVLGVYYSLHTLCVSTTVSSPRLLCA